MEICKTVKKKVREDIRKHNLVVLHSKAQIFMGHRACNACARQLKQFNSPTNSESKSNFHFCKVKQLPRGNLNNDEVLLLSRYGRVMGRDDKNVAKR